MGKAIAKSIEPLRADGFVSQLDLERWQIPRLKEIDDT